MATVNTYIFVVDLQILLQIKTMAMGVENPVKCVDLLIPSII